MEKIHSKAKTLFYSGIEYNLTYTFNKPYIVKLAVGR